ncbi:MAG: DUF4149 domain-containing protein [Rhodocyclaceae bacterium]
MSRIADYLFAIVITVWVGALWAIGFMAAPVLFQQLADRMLAGAIAGKLFTIVAWLGIGSAAYALLYLMSREGTRSLKSAIFWIVLLMLLLTLAGQFGVTPILEGLKAQSVPHDIMEGVLRDRFAMWHGISSVLYLVVSVLGVALTTQVYRR